MRTVFLALFGVYVVGLTYKAFKNQKQYGSPRLPEAAMWPLVPVLSHK